ncbi:TonB-dependent receptor [Algibacter amylolyticus]|uniref:TonB-dependent receptor n=1 Tax=Algibacter amylolyticus TaxID=1608400 RepID=A0A5M7B5M3_9FLAO|nr:TonB-dependent receptor [Algibacter amylolyticus]KAA5824833.1 TonB-dependent receptor [Algibacter amylolyticus]MBB5268959.1 TonB-linked SusC/RagA family outer membrane protein [Algibacter amylolyticus]TSJ75998.1 TonB-dependent receptor [Algibacter amylolyticus]
MNLKIKLSTCLSFNKTFICLILAWSSMAMLNAQTVTGTVSADGQPLPGATVLLKGTSKGTSTDFDGDFTIDADAQSTLVISYVGYLTKEILVGNQTNFNITLQQDNALDEVVVIGYGTQRKSDLTGSVSSVSSEDLTAVPVSRVDQALQGRASGVQVTQTSGAPGAGTVIRVRGGNSITGSNEPLWVIDGIVVGTNFNLNNINSNDIKSIEILKDASSIAIYGSRGANGVVLVSTKNGTGAGAGKPQVSVNLYTSMQLVPELPDMLSQAEQIEFTNESARFRSAAEPFPNDPSTYPDNDWFDILLDPSPIYNADVSISGATDNLNYYTSLNYFNQDGLVKSTGIEKYIFRSNLDYKLSDKVKTGFRVNYSRIEQDNGNASFGNAFATLRTQPIYNEDGTYNGFDEVIGSPWSNPIANIALNTNETFTNNLLASLYLEYKPAPNWIIRSTFSPEFNNTKQNRFTSSQSPHLLIVNDLGNASVRTVASSGWNNENTVQYQSDFGENHSLTALAGASFQKVTTEIAQAEAFGITSDATGFNNLGFSDPTRSVVSSDFTGFQIASFFGRLNYSFKDKYLLTLVGRTDGSSVFAEGNKYEFYPSIAGAWKISEESFMQDQSVFQDLKLRASYGKSGNQAIEPYRTKGILVEANTTINGLEQPGLTLGRPSNPNLIWETTNSLDIALEASLFGGRVFTELNYYYKKTNDLLLDVTIPRQTGFTSQLQNVGSLENKGWEFLVNSTNISNQDFNWNSTLTLSSNKNKILDLGGVDFIDVTVDAILGSGNTRLIVGESVPVFTGVPFLGTWKSQEEIDASGLTDPQVVGGSKFQDVNGDNIISNEDAVVLGSPLPDLIFGFENSFSYKNWEFSFYFQGTVGNEVYNLRTRNHFFNRGETTKFADLANRWTPENPTSNIPRAGADSVTGTPPNSEYVEDGSHLRLKTLRLAYNLPVDKMGLNSFKNATVYFSGSNLLLFSDFRLIDPEASNFGRSGLGNIAQGYNDGSYPNPRVLTLGLNVTF